MRWREIVEDRVDELFDSKTTYMWTTQSHDEWIAQFKMRDSLYTFKAVLTDENDDTWEIMYQLGNVRAKGYEPTGDAGSSASKTLSTVLSIAVDFIKQKQPREITFSGDKANGLSDLYHKMLRFLESRLHHLGYKNTTRPGSSYFGFVKENHATLAQENLEDTMKWFEIVENEDFSNFAWSKRDNMAWSGMLKMNDQTFVLTFKRHNTSWWLMKFHMQGKDGLQLFQLNDFNGIRASRLVNAIASVVEDFVTQAKPGAILMAPDEVSALKDLASAVKPKLPQELTLMASNMGKPGSMAIRPVPKDTRHASQIPLNQRKPS